VEFHRFICYEYIPHLVDPYSSTAVRYGIHRSVTINLSDKIERVQKRIIYPTLSYDAALDQAKCSTLCARRDVLCTKTFDKMRRPIYNIYIVFCFTSKNHNSLNYLFHWRLEDPLEAVAETFFSYPPSYMYYVKATGELFRSFEADHKKVYQELMEKKLLEQL
jgi:hypothetical protein